MVCSVSRHSGSWLTKIAFLLAHLPSKGTKCECQTWKCGWLCNVNIYLWCFVYQLCLPSLHTVIIRCISKMFYEWLWSWQLAWLTQWVCVLWTDYLLMACCVYCLGLRTWQQPSDQNTIVGKLEAYLIWAEMMYQLNNSQPLNSNSWFCYLPWRQSPLAKWLF